MTEVAVTNVPLTIVGLWGVVARRHTSRPDRATERLWIPEAYFAVVRVADGFVVTSPCPRDRSAHHLQQSGRCLLE
jgi:hypothetical protein